MATPAEREYLAHLSNTPMGGVFVHEVKGAPTVQYRRVPGGFVIMGAGAGAFLPLDKEAVKDMRFAAGMIDAEGNEVEQKPAAPQPKQPTRGIPGGQRVQEGVAKDVLTEPVEVRDGDTVS